MRSKHIVPLLALPLLMVVFARTVNSGQDQPSLVEMRFRNLAASVANGRITKIELLQIPPGIETRTGITPEMLEKQFYYRLTFQRMEGSPLYSRLATAMKNASVGTRAAGADLRWGILFYSDDAKRVGAIYFDAGGTRGYVDDTPVSFKGGLFAWVDGTFSNWL
jgi:hypothetical protein